MTTTNADDTDTNDNIKSIHKQTNDSCFDPNIEVSNVDSTKIITTYEQLVSTHPNRSDNILPPHMNKQRKTYGSSNNQSTNNLDTIESSKSNNVEIILKEQTKLMQQIQMEFGENNKYELNVQEQTQSFDDMEDEQMVFDSSQAVVSEDEIHSITRGRNKQTESFEINLELNSSQIHDDDVDDDENNNDDNDDNDDNNNVENDDERLIIDSSQMESNMDSNERTNPQKNKQSQNETLSPSHSTLSSKNQESNKQNPSEESHLVLDSSPLNQDDLKNDDETIVIDSSQMEIHDQVNVLDHNQKNQNQEQNNTQINHDTSHENPSSPTHPIINDVAPNDKNANKDELNGPNEAQTSLTQGTEDNPPTMTNSLFIASIDELYTKADKDTMTVGDIVRAMEAKFNVKLSKKKRRKVRERLTDLSTGRVKLSVSAVDESHPENNESENEYDHDHDHELELEQNTESDQEDKDEEWNQDTERRSKRLQSKKRRRKHHHLQKASNVMKKQKDMEKVIREEMEAAASQLEHSKEHLERMEKIRKKFETNTEEVLQSRFEDRLGLLDKLKKKRMEVIEVDDVDEDVNGDVNEDEKDHQSETKVHISPLQGEQKKNQTLLKVEGQAMESTKSTNDEDLKTNQRKCTSESDESDDELLLISSKPQGQVNLATTFLEATSPAKKRSKKVTNARLLLRKNLRDKTIHAGNAWLARELGYENEEEHILDCQRVENRRKHLLKKQEVSKRKLMEQKSRLFSDHVGDIDYETGELEFKEENDDEADNEDDEELLLAKEIEAESNKAQVQHGEVSNSGDDIDGEKEVIKDAPDRLENENENKNGNKMKSKQIENDDSNRKQKNSEINTFEIKKNELNHTESTMDEEDLATQPILDQTLANEKTSNENTSSPEMKTDERNDLKWNEEKVPIKRNVMWQSMLQKEAEAAKKQKKSNWVETEADEEENDDAVLGLEDFGFTSIKKKNADDEDDEKLFEAKEDDLDIVVDELSDGEGDEEAGEAGRKALQAKEEKEKHREIMRRMRDGYDGRRGGIGGGVARGMHRFDQITAAGNRSDAKRLGLLNDDEIESDEEAELNEKAAENVDDEDEHALLDQMLKDRFLKKEPDTLLFSDDEDEEIENTEKDGEIYVMLPIE